MYNERCTKDIKMVDAKECKANTWFCDKCCKLYWSEKFAEECCEDE